MHAIGELLELGGGVAEEPLDLGRGEGRFELLGERAEVKPYIPLIDSVNNHFREDVKHGFPVQLFADTVQKILDNPRPRTRYQIPRSVTWTIRLRNLMPDLLWDRMMRRALKL